MALKFHNTLTRKTEEFASLEPGKVRMYNCGPTVYNYAHIGNLRQYVFADMLRRTLELNNYEVTQVINITDVGHLASDSDEGEDKMTQALLREGKPMTLEAMGEVAEKYTEYFRQDLQALQIAMPTHMPKATEHIAEDIEIIQKLSDKGFTYTTSDGVYFDTAKDSNYGKLGGLAPIDETDEHSRIGINAEKKSSRDFALWKFNSELGWDTPWGRGFPGWHIECSGMAMKYLGESIDIHTGGIDHIAIHHNNEIAQSENATGKPFSTFWLHGDFLNIEGAKVAKSAGNSIYLKEIIEKGISPLAYRMWLLMAHYRTKVNFSWDALTAANTALHRLYEQYLDLGEEAGTASEIYIQKCQEYLNNDLDTPRALTLLWEVIKDTELSASDRKATILELDAIFDLGFRDIKNETIPDAVQELLIQRQTARDNKEFEKSDQFRDQILELGYEVKDTPLGQKVTKK